MPLTIGVLIAIIVFAGGVAVYVVQLMRERKTVLARMDGQAAPSTPIPIFRTAEEGWTRRIGDWLRARTPQHWAETDAETSSVLVHAGFDGPMAPLFYSTIRLASAVLLPLIAILLAPRDDARVLLAFVALGAAAGLIGPKAVLDNIAGKRRDRIRKSIPDCLDLMVVCVEAGVSLDAAMLRVARDMTLAHPDLAAELLIVNRRMNAGITRDEAVAGLWKRTGLDELRGLSTSIIQSERLGTSIARVLRVYSETLRRKRKQAAEKRAAEAGLKMLIPLALFLLPALFAVILGPVGIKAKAVFERFG